MFDPSQMHDIVSPWGDSRCKDDLYLAGKRKRLTIYVNDVLFPKLMLLYQNSSKKINESIMRMR